MDREEIKNILNDHKKWLRGKGGKHADLSKSNLSESNLCGADLRYADLRGANLCGADLSYADLRGANLSEADLCDADLSGADFRVANLCDANLDGAKISYLGETVVLRFKRLADQIQETQA